MSRLTSTVYVGIVTYNSAHLIEACLNALLKQAYPKVRIVVFDNNSSDDIGKRVQKYPRVRFIQSAQNVGYGRGHNSIISTIPFKRNDYYLTLNPDARLTPTYISRLVTRCRRQKAGWAVGKLYKDIKQTILYSAGHAMFRDGYAFNIGYGMKDTEQYAFARKIFGAPGAAALYSYQLIRDISAGNNFFDPVFFLYYEDIDVDWRANLMGYTCWFEPLATAVHPGGVAPRRLIGDILCNRFIMVIKNAFFMDLLFYNFPIIFFHLVVRLIITPRVGWYMIRQVLKQTKGALHLRKAATISRADMHRWYRDAANEVSKQPRNIVSRSLALITNH